MAVVLLNPVTTNTAPPSPSRLSSADMKADRGFYFSEPTSPVHERFRQIAAANQEEEEEEEDVYEDATMFNAIENSFQFEISCRYRQESELEFHTAEELFFNGQIRPLMTLQTQNQSRSQPHSPRLSLDSSATSEEISGSRRTLHSFVFQEQQQQQQQPHETQIQQQHKEEKQRGGSEGMKSASTKSRGSCSNRWSAIKDLLYMNRSSSEGRADTRAQPKSASSSAAGSPAMQAQKHSLHRSNQFDRKRVSDHHHHAAGKSPNSRVPVEFQHYMPAKNGSRVAPGDEKRRSFLPYKSGLLGCLFGFRTSPAAFSTLPRNLRS